MTIDDLWSGMQAGFKRIDERFVQVDERFTQVDERFAQVDERITAEGETTRRRFDVLAEDSRDMIRIIAEATAQNTQRLDDHETRLTRLETRRE